MKLECGTGCRPSWPPTNPVSSSQGSPTKPAINRFGAPPPAAGARSPIHADAEARTAAGIVSGRGADEQRGQEERREQQAGLGGHPGRRPDRDGQRRGRAERGDGQRREATPMKIAGRSARRGSLTEAHGVGDPLARSRIRRIEIEVASTATPIDAAGEQDVLAVGAERSSSQRERADREAAGQQQRRHAEWPPVRRSPPQAGGCRSAPAPTRYRPRCPSTGRPVDALVRRQVRNDESRRLETSQLPKPTKIT